MTAVLIAVVLVGLLATVFFWQRLVRTWQASSSLLMWLALLSLMLAVATQITSVHDVLAYRTPWNLFWAPQWALVMCCSVILHIVAIRVTVPIEQQRRRILFITGAMAGTFALAVVMFATAPHDPDFVLGPASRTVKPGPISVPVWLAWLLIMIVMAASCVSHTRYAHQWAKHSEHAAQVWLRAGMRSLTAGLALCVAYFAHAAAYQTAMVLGWYPPYSQETVTSPLISAGPALVFVGLVLPSVGSWRRERTEGSDLLRRLEPLRQLTARRIPRYETRLDRFRRWWLRQWRPTLLVYQVMIDLADAQLRIPRQITETATAGADGAELGGETLDAVVLAASLAAWTTGSDAGQLVRTLTGEAVEHPDQELSPDEKRRVALTIDLRRWLRAADLLNRAPATT